MNDLVECYMPDYLLFWIKISPVNIINLFNNTKMFDLIYTMKYFILILILRNILY